MSTAIRLCELDVIEAACNTVARFVAGCTDDGYALTATGEAVEHLASALVDLTHSVLALTEVTASV